jgi:uncharacterized membrane protein YfcA
MCWKRAAGDSAGTPRPLVFRNAQASDSGLLDYTLIKNSMKSALFVALGIFTASFALIWILAIIRTGRERPISDATPKKAPGPLDVAIGFFTNFLDTLGIGSFATTSSIFKVSGLVKDEQIPGTLNVGHCIPSILEAFIYIAVVEVDVTTLILMIAAASIGAWLGAGVVCRWPRRNIQIGMGSVLIAAAILMVLQALMLFPGGGDLLALSGVKLAIGIVCNMMLGALMTIGIGLFAPCMILVYLLGMSPKVAFPIMMGSCAFLMPVGSARFIRTGRYNLKAALGLTLGGIPGVLLAAFIVKSLDVNAVRWLVAAVVVYTAAMMLHSAARERKQIEAAVGVASAATD